MRDRLPSVGTFARTIFGNRLYNNINLNKENLLLLAEKYNFDGDVQQIKPLIDRAGGHPYLLGEAFAHL
ncbi:hypothetical protein GNE10_31480 [Nostoc sp. 2RC]|nr:hypothetical protein [Nostoc sp. 2RC]